MLLDFGGLQGFFLFENRHLIGLVEQFEASTCQHGILFSKEEIFKSDHLALLVELRRISGAFNGIPPGFGAQQGHALLRGNGGGLVGLGVFFSG